MHALVPNHIIVEMTRRVEFFDLGSGWFNFTDILRGEEGVQGALVRVVQLP